MLLAAGAIPELTPHLLPDSAALGLVAVQAAVFGGRFPGFFALRRAGGPVLLSLLGAVGALVGVPVVIGILSARRPRPASGS